MNTKKNDSLGATPRRRGRGVKVAGWGLVIVAVVILLVFFIVPLYLSSDSGRDLIVSRINDSVDGTVKMKSFSMGWFKGIRLTDLSFRDDAGQTSVNVREISTKPSYSSLLGGGVVLGETVVDAPEVVINIKERDTTAQKTIAPTQPTATKGGKGAGMGLERIDLDLRGGNVSINMETLNREIKRVEFKDIESKLNLNPPGEMSTFDVSLAVADGEAASKISAKGNLTPSAKKNWTLKGTSGDFNVKVEKLNLESLGPLLALMGIDAGAGGELNADVDIKIDDGRFEKLKATAVLTGFKKTLGDKEAMLDEPIKIDAELSSSEEAIDIDRLNIESSFCSVNCTGGANSVNYIATADLEGLQNFAQQFKDFGDSRLTGDLKANGKVSFGDNTIHADGQSSIDGLIIRKGTIITPTSFAKVDFDIQTDANRDIIKVSSAKVVSSPGTIAITNSALPLTDKGKDSLKLALAADVDLQKLLPFARLSESFPQGLEMAGMLKSDLSVSTKRGVYHIVTDKTNIKKLRVKQAGQEEHFQQEEVKLILDVLCDPEEKSLEIETFDLESSDGESLIKITKGQFGQVSSKGRIKFNGELEAEYDLATVSSIASGFIPQGLVIEGKRTTKLTLQSEYPANATDNANGLLANLNAETRLGFDSAQYMGLEFGKADMGLRVKDGALSIDLPETTVNGGKISFAGGINFKENPLVLKMAGPRQLISKVNINDRMSRRMLMYLNPLFANQANVSGVANFHCDKLIIPLAEGTQNDIEVEGTVGMDQVRLQTKGLLGQIMSVAGAREEELTLLPTKFFVQNGIVRYDDMQINVGDKPVNFAGRIGLDKSLAMDVTLPFTVAGRTARVGDSAGSRITLPIEGTLDNPSINAQKAIEKMAPKILEDALKGELEKIFKKGEPKEGEGGGEVDAEELLKEKLRDIFK